MLRIYLSILALMCFAASGFAKESSDSSPGAEVDAKAADFELLDQNEKKVKLSTLIKKGPVAVVFHRSAGW